MTGLREALDAAVTQAETASAAEATPAPAEPSPEREATPEPVQTPTEEPASPSPEREEPPAAEAKPEATPETKPEAKPEDAAAAAEEAKLQHRVDRAPNSWKKETKEAWNSLPLSVRQEIHRREQTINQMMVENSRNREAVENLNRVTGPYMARLQTMGGPIQGIERLLQTEYMLATGNSQQTAQYMAQLIRDYDVDLSILDNVLSGQQSAPQQPAAADISQLVQQQVQQALAPFQQAQQQRQQKVMQEAAMTVEQMSLDPNYPYFEDVRDDMADIIDMRAKRGLATTLEEAYSIAVSVNPETATAVRQQATVQTATQHHQSAQRAKAAASSVSGSPAGGGSAVQTGDGSLRGAIEAAFGGQRL